MNASTVTTEIQEIEFAPSAPKKIQPEPLVWLGANSAHGLALPAANPTPSQLYAPRGVFFDDKHFIVADSGNHRVMIWHSLPECDGQSADVVLGQADFYSEGANANGASVENGLHLPTGVGVYEGRLFVADSWHHRILVWNEVPQASYQKPDYVIGQTNLSEVFENRGAVVSARSLYWAYGIAYIAGWFYAADTGNRRVLGWRGLPEPEQAADLVLGQSEATENLENRGAAVSAKSFRWAHDLAGNDKVLYVADAGNHRVLGWSPTPVVDSDANIVFGQTDFVTAQEFPYKPQSANALRFPYAIAAEDDLLAVADTANNRVLFWQTLPTEGANLAADAVIGQSDFKSNGENRWKRVEHDTLCWPYGIHLHKDKLAIADSGNNRVMIWKIR
jgi:hypothetical protein